ncbi:hypothetical protein [Streptomyces nodosus]|uniref:hypothetical protein n=1 Tax=Streptomyces nodosus TaxID=40318 RepID=UPI00130EA40F|nr:hypothetical protein [Streptomyces nodosus]MBB4794335.1 hypothetical protein [Streptomyces nodosus]
MSPTYEYDAVGNIVSETDFDGARLTTGGRPVDSPTMPPVANWSGPSVTRSA